MGSGKTTLGRLLSDALNRKFTDLDHFIEERENATVPELFKRYGEDRFRELERLAIHETAHLSDAIIATGGGAPCYFNNMDVMNQNGITIYLKLSPESLVDRLLPGREHRPLIKGKNETELLDYIRFKLAERELFYQKANIIADTDSLSPEETVKIIVKAMELTGK